MQKYSCVTLPVEVVQIIDALKKDGGFASRCEFVKYLVRKEVLLNK